MADYDMIVYGATGFTGLRVARYLKQAYTGKFSFAIAGRNAAKLEEIREELGEACSGIVIADSSNPETIANMCTKAKIVLACVGPFRLYGEPVVEACAKSGTHYVDITGEPEFIEQMENKYMDEAKKSGAIIVSACGFDSIPADMGTVFSQRQFKGDSVCTVVQAFLSFTGAAKANYATYESAIRGFGSSDNLRKLRKEVNQERAKIPGKKPGPPKRGYNKEFGVYTIPFIGSDPSIVKRSQNSLYQLGEPASHFRSFVTIKSSKNYYGVLGGGALIGSLAGLQFGRKLLLNNPKFFTRGLVVKGGPDEEELKTVNFYMKFKASGYSDPSKADTEEPDIRIITQVSGPEPGYVATPVFVVEAAITILESGSKIKDFVKADGGVFPSAVAFYNTDIIDRLQNAGIKFEVLES